MADVYGDVAGFKVYHIARGRDVDGMADAAINSSLLVASEWIDATYRVGFPGEKVGKRAQVREWPRTDAYDIDDNAIPSDEIPIEVINATYEAAYIQIEAPGSLVINWTPGKYKRVSVDGAISVEYASFMSASDIQTVFVGIDQIIAPVLSASGADFSSLSGAVSRI